MNTILHISDLHIDLGDLTQQALRPDNLESYLGELGKALREKIKKPVSALVLTGDFPHRCGEYWKHGEFVVAQIAKHVGIPPGKTVLCPGNHDFKWNLGTRTPESIGAFCAFYEKIAGGKPLCAGKFIQTLPFDLRELGKGFLALTLDALFDSPDHRRPAGRMPQQHIDAIRKALIEYRNHSGPITELIVASHYPPALKGFDLHETVEKKRFFPRHVWTEGAVLETMLDEESKRGAFAVSWFSGDIHVNMPGQIRKRGEISYHTTGRFNGPKARDDAKPSFQYTCKVITRNKSYVFYWDERGYNRMDHAGRWLSKVDERVATKAAPAVSVAPLPSSTPAPHDHKKILSVLLEGEICDRVKEHRLLSLGRFPTSDQEGATMIWLKTDELLGGEVSPFGAVVEEFSRAIAATMKSESKDKAVLLGLDVYGSMMAGLISPSVGIPAWCATTSIVPKKPARKEAKPTAAPIFRQFDANLLRQIGKQEVIFLITDVVRSGNSIKQIVEKIEKAVTDRPRPRIHLLAVVINKSLLSGSGGGKLPALSSVRTCCGRIEMMFISKGNLPDDFVLPPTRSINDGWDNWPQ